MPPILRSLALAAGVVLAGAAFAAADPFGSLTIDEVATKLGQKGVYVFDNNPADVYKQAHVPGARWLDYKNVSASDLPADKDATLIFYCANEH